MGLAESIEQQTRQRVEQVGAPIDSLVGVARQLKQDDVAQRLQDTRASLETDTFNLIVLGRFKTGKSTFLNALLGRLTHPVPELAGGSPLPVNDLPCTATLTRILYEDSPHVRVFHFESNPDDWSLKRYLSEATIRPDSEETRRFFQNIREFALYYPAELLRAGFTLIDSPGVDEDPVRDRISKEALRQCDAAIVLFRSDALAGMSERAFVQEMKGDGLTRFFTVVNLWNGRAVDEALKHTTWDKLVTEMEEDGPRYTAGQDMSGKDIYFVDAHTALTAKLADDQTALVDSGMAFLEQRLTDFLEHERRMLHVTRWVQQALKYVQDLESAGRKLIAALQMDEQQFRQNYTAIQPQLEDIRRRRDRLPKIIEHYRKEADLVMQASFEQLFSEIQRTLPDELKARPLPSLNEQTGFADRFKSAFQRKRLAEEAAQLAATIIKEKITAWERNDPSQPGAQQQLGPIITRMAQEISAEVAEIDKGLRTVDLQLTGWDPNAFTSEAEGPSTMQRTLLTAVGVVLLQPDLALGAGVLGWEGFRRALAIDLVGGVIIAIIGAPLLLPAVLAASIYANFIWGADRLADRIKGETVNTIINGDPKRNLAGLRGQLTEARPKVSEAVGKLFGDLAGVIAGEVNAAIASKEQGIRAALEANTRSLEEKQQLLIRANGQLKLMEQSQQALKAALTAASQM